ncbi:MAG: hypothetical protein WCL29_06810, partial [Pseudomonadota bacterium]
MRTKLRFFSIAFSAVLPLLCPAADSVKAGSTEPATITPFYEPNDALLIALPRMAEAQVRELIADIATQYRLTAGFRSIDVKTLKVVAPGDVSVIGAIAFSEGSSGDTVVMGYALPPRRLPQLWVAAWHGDANSRSPWQQLAGGPQSTFAKTVQSLLSERNKIFSRLGLNDLESRVLNLSYVDTDAALFALRAMGYAAITDSEPMALDEAYRGADMMGDTVAGMPAAGGAAGAVAAGGSPYASLQGLPPDELKRLLPKFPAIKNLPTSVNFDRLPLIVRLPSTEQRNMGLVGGAEGVAAPTTRDTLGLTVVPQAASSLTETVTGGASQLMVMFHPAYPEQFQKLRHVVQETIDRPARQVFVEGLVLEISSEALRDLGVKWDLKKGTQSFSVGSLTSVAPGDNALSLLRDGALAITPSQMMARINALVQTNKAEILSRPSVLTLDNRQATIRVGTDIPVATSKDASSAGSGSSRVAFSFQYIPTGILLNVRPRISDDGSEISMLIDATVSATVPN